MSNPTLSTGVSPRALALRMLIGVGVSGAVVAAAILPGILSGHAAGPPLPPAHLHAPDWSLVTHAPLAMQAHLYTVVAALVLGTLQMVGPKGRTAHRVLGWTLVLLLMFTAVAALFIRSPFSGHFSPLHLFSLWTLIVVPLAVVSARQHKVPRHARIMASLYFGGLIFAGLLAFIPGRLLWRVFFG